LTKDDFASWNKKKDGARVNIVTNSSEEFIGELLAIRDSTMLIYKIAGLSDEELTDSIDKIISIESKNINIIKVLGDDEFMKTWAIVTLIGAATGVVIGFADGDDPGAGKEGSDGILQFSAEQKAYIGCCTFGAGGALIGILAGISTITPDKAAYSEESNEYSIIELKVLARYKDTEPDFLKAIK
jgi:hypothetical protein